MDQPSLFPTFLTDKDKALLLDAIRYLQTSGDHDAYLKLRHRYGPKPWEESDRIQRELQKLVDGRKRD